MVVLPVVVGTLLGGWMVSRWAMRVRAVLVFGLATTTMGALCCLGILFYCPSPPTAGLNAAYPKPDCHLHCHCSPIDAEPVCDSVSGLSYQSPCHAGCQGFSQSKQEYSNCSCAEGRSVILGVCKTEQCADTRIIFLGSFEARKRYSPMC